MCPQQPLWQVRYGVLQAVYATRPYIFTLMQLLQQTVSRYMCIATHTHLPLVISTSLIFRAAPPPSLRYFSAQNTGDGKRPGVPPPSSQSQEYGELHNRDSLSMTSGTHQKVDPAKLARLGEELGIGVGPSVPPPPPELSVMAGRDDGEGVVKPASPAGTAADMEEALSAGAAALNNFSEDHSGSTRPSPALTQQQQQIQVQDGEVASVTSVGDGDGKGSHVVPTLGAEGGSSAKGGSGGPAGGASEAEGARQRRGAGRGGSGGSVSEVLSAGGGGDAKNGAPIIDGQVKIEEEERERRGVVGQGDQLEMSFQGYDFNTLRKVGSVRVQGMGGARLSMGPSPPTLARKSVSEGRT